MTNSDGYTQFKTFFASDACKMIISGEVKTFSVFELINAVVNITDKAMVIIVKINLLYDNLTDIIGKPMEFDEYKSKVCSFNIFLNIFYVLELPKSQWKLSHSSRFQPKFRGE